MRRTSILVDPGVMTELERLARRAGRPTAHLIREAMERYVATESQPRELPGFVGMGHGPGDVAERAKQILDQELAEHLATGIEEPPR